MTWLANCNQTDTRRADWLHAAAGVLSKLGATFQRLDQRSKLQHRLPENTIPVLRATFPQRQALPECRSALTVVWAQYERTHTNANTSNPTHLHPTTNFTYIHTQIKRTSCTSLPYSSLNSCVERLAHFQVG
jgi:hypothetical protein